MRRKRCRTRSTATARETGRLYGVLDRRLAGRAFIADAYSIADIACYPWIVPYRGHGQDLDAFPNLKRWFEAIAARPATIRAYADTSDSYAPGAKPMSDEERRILFGQTAASGAGAAGA